MSSAISHEGLETPYIYLREATLHSNLARLAEYTAEHGIKLRPHAKTHKSLRIGRWQVELGAVGLAVAKLGEALLFAEVCQDLLLAYPVVDELRAARVAELAKAIRMTVAIDSAEAAECISRAAARVGTIVGIVVDLDVGLHRTGVPTPQAACELAQVVERLPNVELRGLFIYPGHVMEPAESQMNALRPIAERLQQALELWLKYGLNCEMVSGGSTPTAYQSHLLPQVTEIRPGTYVYNDMNTVRGGFATLDECAARLRATVVSTAVTDQVVIDAGSKTLTSDRSVMDGGGFGYIMEYPEARIVRLNEEHGQVDVRECPRRPRVGERVTVIPNHICPCINLQDSVWLESASGELESLAVDARGKIR